MPEAGRSLDLLPLERLAALAEARRPSFWVLEAAWELYEVTRAELLAVRAMWGDPPFRWRLAELVVRVDDGRYPLEETQREHVWHLARELAAGRIELGELVACRAAVAGPPVPDATAETLCLLDGHHRVIALALEGRLPSTCAVFVGSAPVALGRAVLNGGVK